MILKGARVAGGSIFTYIEDTMKMQRRAAELICGIEERWLSALKTTHRTLTTSFIPATATSADA